MKCIMVSLVAVLLLCSCDDRVSDVCIRQEVFENCINSVPKERAEPDEWRDIIYECGAQARGISIRKGENIKKECM